MEQIWVDRTTSNKERPTSAALPHLNMPYWQRTLRIRQSAGKKQPVIVSAIRAAAPVHQPASQL